MCYRASQWHRSEMCTSGTDRFELEFCGWSTCIEPWYVKGANTERCQAGSILNTCHSPRVLAILLVLVRSPRTILQTILLHHVRALSSFPYRPTRAILLVLVPSPRTSVILLVLLVLGPDVTLHDSSHFLVASGSSYCQGDSGPDRSTTHNWSSCRWRWKAGGQRHR